MMSAGPQRSASKAEALPQNDMHRLLRRWSK